MADKYRGSKGHVALGGIVTGSPLVDGAVAQGAASADIDGVSLTGVILKGDTFTVAGDAQVYTMTTDVLIVANAAAIEFSPGVVPGAGWLDNAAITFTSNALAQVRSFEANISRPVIEAAVMGDDAGVVDLDEPSFTGSVTCLFDNGDPRQAAAIDEVHENSALEDLGIILRTDTGKQLYGHIAMQVARIASTRGRHVEVAFEFSGNGALSKDWT